MSYVIVQLLKQFLNRWNEVFSDGPECASPNTEKTHGIPVAAVQAASGFTAWYQMDHLVRRRGLRRCYKDCGVSVAAVQAASGLAAVCQMHRANRRRGLRRCYRDCGVSVAAVQAASGGTAVCQMHRANRRRGLRRCYGAVSPCPLRLPGAPGASARGCWSGAGAWRRARHRNPGGRWRRRFPRARD